MSEKRRNGGVHKILTGLSDQRRRAQDEVRRDKRNQQAKRFRAADASIVDEGRDKFGQQCLLTADDYAQMSKIGTPAGQEALKNLRRHLSRKDAPIKAIIDGGVLPHLIVALRVSDEAVQGDALWCLTNMATGDHEDTWHVLQAAPELIHLLAGTSSSLAEHACWTLGNIAADSDEFRMTLIANGIVQPMLVLLESSVSESVSATMALSSKAQTVAWAISNLARGSTSAEHLLPSGSVPLLISLTLHADAALVYEMWWIFTFLTAKSVDAVNLILQHGLANAVVAALAKAAALTTSDVLGISYANAPAAIVPILRTLGNLTSGPIEWIDLLLQHPQILPVLTSLTSRTSHCSNSVAFKEALWVIRNILGKKSMLNCISSLISNVIAPSPILFS